MILKKLGENQRSTQYIDEARRIRQSLLSLKASDVQIFLDLDDFNAHVHIERIIPPDLLR